MYATSRQKFNERADKFAEMMDQQNDWSRPSTLLLLWEIAKDSPTVSKQNSKQILN